MVGAFKCGTTALYDYLRQHPAVYMPFHKEPLYFGDDLTRRYGRMTEAQYLDLWRRYQTIKFGKVRESSKVRVPSSTSTAGR